MSEIGLYASWTEYEGGELGNDGCLYNRKQITHKGEIIFFVVQYENQPCAIIKEKIAPHRFNLKTISLSDLENITDTKPL